MLQELKEIFHKYSTSFDTLNLFKNKKIIEMCNYMSSWQIQKNKLTIFYILIRCNFDCSYWKRPVQWEFCANIIQKIWDKTMKGYLKRHCNIHCICDKWNGKDRKLPNFSLGNWLCNYKQFIKERIYLSLNKYYLHYMLYILIYI